MNPHLTVRLEPPVARLTLDRPPLNVITTGMLEALADGVERASATGGVRLLRIDATGKLFSAGVDVGDHEPGRLRPMLAALEHLFDALGRTPLPTVAVVQGPALGGGCELAMGTDLCLASERASFGQPEIKLGLFAPPGSVLLPRVVGERRALGLLLTGETVDAASAERMGLVNAVLPEDGFEVAVKAWVGRLLALSGSSLRLAKRAVAAARGRPVGEALRAVDRLYADELMRTADAAEGLAAFRDKRRPDWQHS